MKRKSASWLLFILHGMPTAQLRRIVNTAFGIRWPHAE